jgi:pilus assembly protein CpaF
VNRPVGESDGGVAGALLDRVRRRLAISGAEFGGEPADLAAIAREESRLLVDSAALADLSHQLDADLRGAGPLEPLLASPGVTDVLVNAPTEVYLDRGHGLERADVQFANDAEVRSLAVRLAAQAGRRLDDAMPYVDASLPDGTRLHALLTPLAAHPVICLRVLRRRQLSLAELIAAGMMTPPVARLLRAAVEARLTILISGGTGTGKTTLLGALLSQVAEHERVITIEDAAELTTHHRHVVALLARSANVEGAGAVPVGELVRQSLRMRGDRIVVGEFRGGEIVELLAALNTGHAGGAATVHANSIADVPARLVALAALGGMPDRVLAAQTASALDVLVHLERATTGVRAVREVALWTRSGGLDRPATVWSAPPKGGVAEGGVAESYMDAGGGLGVAAAELAMRIRRSGVAVPELLQGVPA